MSAKDMGIEPPRGSGGGEARDRQRYRDIREKIESRNVFTMQDAIPAEDEASGFALVRPEPAVVLANSRDTIRRRIFTLLHEYAHVALSRDGVCAAEHVHPVGGGAQRVERWCNRFAAAALMPKGRFLDALGGAGGNGEPLMAAGALADRFCVSRAAALVRAMEVLEDGRDRAKYSRCYAQLRRGAAAAGGGTADRSAPGGPSQAALCLARKGHRYARLVFDAEEAGAITTSTVLGHLDIKISHLDEVVAGCG